MSSLIASTASSSRPAGSGRSRNGSSRRRSSPVGRRRMCRALRERRRSGSKTAGLAPRRVGSHSRGKLLEVVELLPALRMGPAEQRQVVHERFGQVAVATILGDAGGAVALGELLAVGTQDQAEVDELGLLPAERPVQERLAGGVREVLLAPDDVGDAHLEVVDDGGEVVRRGAVGLDEHEVPDLAEGDLAPQCVPEGPAPLRRPEVERPPARLVLGLVGQSHLREARGGLLVERAALALAVRALVEGEAEPVEIVRRCLARTPRGCAPGRCPRCGG